MGKIFVGSFLIILGLGFFLEQTPLGLIGFNMGSIWAIFWIIIGFLLLRKRLIFVGTLFVIWGILSFIKGFINIDIWAWFFPLIIIALGIRILFKKDNKSTNGETIGTTVKETSDQEYINESVLFGSLEKKYTSQNFKGGKIDCLFGGIKVDLRSIKPSEDAELEVNAIFGGGEILVGDSYRVEANGTGVFGGWTNHFSTGDSGKSILKIKGTAVFGGIEVKK